MAHLLNWFGLLPPDIATILPWSKRPDKPLLLTALDGHHQFDILTQQWHQTIQKLLTTAAK